MHTINWRQIIAYVMAFCTVTTYLQIKLLNLEPQVCAVYAQLTPYGYV